MAGYRGHLIAGAVSVTAVAGLCWWLGWYRPDGLTMLSLVATAMLASLFPDTDTCSMGRRVFYLIMLGLDVVLIINGHYEWAAILGLLAILPAIGPHRGWTHAWWAGLLAPLPIIILPLIFFSTGLPVTLPFYLAGVVGYASHLALDRWG